MAASHEEAFKYLHGPQAGLERLVELGTSRLCGQEDELQGGYISPRFGYNRYITSMLELARAMPEHA